MTEPDLANNSVWRPNRLYSAPRRFDLATILVVTIAYSLFFTGLRMLDATPVVYVNTIVLVTLVGASQALLFGGKRPRWASVLTGIMLNLALLAFLSITRPQRAPVILLWWFIAMGAICGYVAGVAVGSVFLLSDLARNMIRRWRPDQE